MLKAGILLPSGTGKFPDPVLFEDYDDIRHMINDRDFGLLSWDEVVNGERVAITGFVADSIKEVDDSNMNWFASALFNKPVGGDVMLAWHLSPSGSEDGDVYDMPDWVSAFIFGDFTEGVVRCYGEATLMSHLFIAAVNDNVVSEDDMRLVMRYMESTQGGNAMPLTVSEKLQALDAMERIDAYISSRESEFMGGDDE
jgi:hypothetical protein